MAETFAILLTSHLLGDFLLQNEWIIRNKRRLAALLVHVATVTAVTWLLLGDFNGPVLGVIFFSHLAMDAIKSRLLGDSIKPFLLDQAIHIAVLVALSYWKPEAATQGWIGPAPLSAAARYYFALLSLASGLILLVPAGGFMIGKATARFMDEIGTDDIEGLKQGGQYIGWLERTLVLLLLLIDQPGGIGFLIAAKSILRFGEIKDATQRKVAEYIIIGTFLSFGWALLIASLTQRAIWHWLAVP